MNNRLIASLVAAIFSLIVLADCRYGQKFHSEIWKKNELVVAADINMPDYLPLNDGILEHYYDILQAYADKLNVTLRIITGNTHDYCLRMLKKGRADIVLSFTNEPDEQDLISICTTSYVILAAPGKPAEKMMSLGEMNGSRMLMSSGFRMSKYYGQVFDAVYDSLIFISADNTKTLMSALADNEYDYLICEKNEALLGSKQYKKLRLIGNFADDIHVTAALSSGVRGLKEDFTTWLYEYHAQYESPAESFNLLKYSRNISQYDDVIRAVAEREGFDWRFLSAIAYHESRFKPHVVSSRNAVGIMQITPVVARNFNISCEHVADTETNIMLAVKLLKNIEQNIQLPATTTHKDRMSIVLACYNAGIGHITDARSLAEKHGHDANCWKDISHFLQLKSRPEYYRDEVVRNGIFRGSRQTLAFVHNVMGRYDNYCLFAQR